MSEGYKLLNIKDVCKGLSVSVYEGTSLRTQDREQSTEMTIKPPLSPDERASLVASAVTKPELISAIAEASYEPSYATTLSLKGKPGQEHVDLAVSIAEQIMALRGLKAALIYSLISDDMVTHLLQANE